MKNNTKTTTKKTAKKTVAKPVAKKTRKSKATCKCESILAQENKIIERSILVTSLLINLFFLVGWVAIAANSEYARALGRVIYNM
jgi:hypothetical protein